MSAQGKKQNLTIKKGTTFVLPVRWQDSTLVYKGISAITRTGAMRVTAIEHGCPDGWEAALMNALREVDAVNNPPDVGDWHIASNIDSNTVEFNSINSAGFRAYAGGGQLVYYAPKPLTGCTARCQFKDDFGGTVLYEPTLAVDGVGYAITLTVPAEDSQDFDFTQALYDLEIEDGSGVVTTLLYGAVVIDDEITTL